MTPRFQFTSVAQQIFFGAGELNSLAERLDSLDSSGVRRALLCTSSSYVRNGVAARITILLGARLAGVFADVLPHVPEASVAAALALADQLDAGMVIGLGGGSALGTAKAVATGLSDRREMRPAVPLVAVPTTYAGSEMTPIYGVTRAAEGRKVTVADVRALPGLVVYDPALTLDLPADLTASTGINALAHCVEGVYSTTRSPVSTATALAGLTAIGRALPRCVADGGDVAARDEMLRGAYLAGTTIAHAGIAIHHGLCHVLGGTAGVPHGVANAIMLPHAMRFNLPVCAAELAAVAYALGVEPAGQAGDALGQTGQAGDALGQTGQAGDAAGQAGQAGDAAGQAGQAGIDAVVELIGSLGMPRRLRDAGVAASDLPRLAGLALKSAAVRANPRPVASAEEIEAIFRTAW